MFPVAYSKVIIKLYNHLLMLTLGLKCLIASFTIFSVFHSTSSVQVLSTVDAISNPLNTLIQMPALFMGLSIPFASVYPYLSSTLLQSYIKNSVVYGSYQGSFIVSLKMQNPKGYKFNCTFYQTFAPNATCTIDVNSYLSAIGRFFNATIGFGDQQFLGYDMQAADFTNYTYTTNFQNYISGVMKSISNLKGYYPLMEFYDNADMFVAKGIRNSFSPTDFINEAQTVWNNIPYEITGPGVTENADPSWMDSYYDFNDRGLGIFTVQVQPFNDTSQLTVANILNESNYRDYLYRRFRGTNGLLDFSKGSIAISRMQLISGNGVAGITDSMVAAIWALDLILQALLMGVQYVMINNDLSASNLQSPLGPSPTFTPRATYYAMLLLSIIRYSSPVSMGIPTVYPGASNNIKIYSFNNSANIGFLLINKDINPNASGIIQINMKSPNLMKCLYMSASSLTSSSLTLGGYYFIGNNSAPQGNFSQPTFTNVNNQFNIPLNYSQVAYCTVIASNLDFDKVVMLIGHHISIILTVIMMLFLM